MSYTPPLVTETNESNWNDCTFASGLMGVAKWSKGILVADNEKGRKWQREQMRKGAGLPPHHDGANLDELAEGIKSVWPGLKMLYPGVYSGGVRLSWGQFLQAMELEWGFVIMGDELNLPVRLRNWTVNDNFKHALYLEGQKRNGVLRGWLLDPLAPAGFKGAAITIPELKRFMYTRDDGCMRIAIFPTGEVVSKDQPYISEEYRNVIDVTVAGVTSAKEKVLVKGQRILQWPLGPELKTLYEDQSVTFIGESPWTDRWHAVLVKKDNKPVIGWVPANAGAVKDAPVVPPPVSDEALLAQVALLTEAIFSLSGSRDAERTRADDVTKRLLAAKGLAADISNL